MSVGGRRPAGVPARRRGGAAARLGRGHRVRRPRRAGARGVRAGLAPGVGVGARSAWAAAARWSPSASSSAPARRPATSTSSSPTTRSWRSTPSRAARCCPSTTCSSSTRATSSSTGSPRRSPTRSPPGMVARRGQARRAPGRRVARPWTRPPTCSSRCSSRPPRGGCTGIPDSLGAGAGPGARHRPRRAERAQAAAGRGARRRPPGGARRRRRGLRERRAHPRGARARRRVAQPRPAAWPGAARRPDERGDARARQGLRGPHRRADLGHARARWVVRRRRRHDRPARRGCARTWRGLDVGSPFDYPEQGIAYVARHLPPPGRDGLATETLDEIEALVRAAGGRTLGPVLVDARGQGGHRGDARAVRRPRGRHPVPLPGRGPDQHPGAAVRPRPAHLPVRHAVALAGRRRAGLVVPARHHRPHPVPAPRRPAGLGALAGHRADGRQRLHGRLGHARRAAAGAGRGSPHPAVRRPRRRRVPRQPDDDRALRRLPPALAATVLADGRPRDGARGARTPRRDRRAAAAGRRAGAARADRRGRRPRGRRRPRCGCRGAGSRRAPGRRGPATAGVVAHRRHARARVDRAGGRGAARRHRARACTLDELAESMELPVEAGRGPARGPRPRGQRAPAPLLRLPDRQRGDHRARLEQLDLTLASGALFD